MIDWVVDRLLGVVAVAYAVVIVAVAVVRWGTPVTHTYVAARNLVHNHRILPDDFEHPASTGGRFGFYLPDRNVVEGKYVVTACIAAGEPVRSRDVRVGPDLAVGADERPVVFPLSGHLARALDAGGSVALLGEDPVSKGLVSIPATVHSIGCTLDAKNVEMCYAVLALRTADEPFVSKNTAGLRIVPQETRRLSVGKGERTDAPTNVAQDRQRGPGPAPAGQSVDPCARVPDARKADEDRGRRR